MTGAISERVQSIFEKGKYGSEFNPHPFDADDMTRLAEDCVKDAIETLMLSTNVYVLNGIGEVKMLTDYNVTDTNISVDEVVRRAMLERSTNIKETT